jgi:D-lactate dehydrogenase (cytochrome)
MTNATVAQLLDTLEPESLVTDAGAMAPYLSEQRGRFAGHPVAAVARPETTGAVACVVAACHQAGMAVIPQGGNTGLCGGAAARPDEQAIILSLERLNRIRSVDAQDFSLVAEAGCRLSAVQAAAAAADRLFPLSYAAEADCQIGGNLATNAGGMNVLRYGNARDLTLGLEVVLADGRIWHGLRRLRKDNSGYDLKDLFIGAEGSLGIITAASLKLFPAIRQRATAIVGLDSVEQAIALFGTLRQASGDTLSSCELMGRRPLDFAFAHDADCVDPLAAPHAWYLLVEASSSADDTDLADRLEQAMAAAAVGDYRIADDARSAAAFWRLRNTIPAAQKIAGASIKNDISVPITGMGEFIQRAGEAVTAACPGTRICAFGHLGDGNIHFNLTRPEDSDDADFLARWADLTAVVHDEAVRLGGSFAAEHGVGQLKPTEVQRLKDPIEQALMRRVKAALDPADTLNPGKVVPPGDQSA